MPQCSSPVNVESQQLPLTEADISHIVNAVLQGLPPTDVSSTPQLGKDEGLEHFNGECVLYRFSVVNLLCLLPNTPCPHSVAWHASVLVTCHYLAKDDMPPGD